MAFIWTTEAHTQIVSIMERKENQSIVLVSFRFSTSNVLSAHILPVFKFNDRIHLKFKTITPIHE